MRPNEYIASIIATNLYSHTLVAITNELSVFQIYPFVYPYSFLDSKAWTESRNCMQYHSPQAVTEFEKAWEMKEISSRNELKRQYVIILYSVNMTIKLTSRWKGLFLNFQLCWKTYTLGTMARRV